MRQSSQHTEKDKKMSKRATYRVNADKWPVLQDILCCTPNEFNPDSASLRGRTMNVGLLSQLGRLPDEWRAKWHEDKGEIDYAIWSYGTPIAWRVTDMWLGNLGQCYSSHWVMPDVKYSVTTSKHQGKVRTALSQISGGI